MLTNTSTLHYNNTSKKQFLFDLKELCQEAVRTIPSPRAATQAKKLFYEEVKDVKAGRASTL